MAVNVSPDNPEQRKRGVRRSTLWLTVLALAFYGAFILMSVLRAQ